MAPDIDRALLSNNDDHRDGCRINIIPHVDGAAINMEKVTSNNDAFFSWKQLDAQNMPETTQSSRVVRQ